MVIEKHGWVCQRDDQYQLWCGRTTADADSVASDWDAVTCGECRLTHDRLIRLMQGGGVADAGVERRVGGTTARPRGPAQEPPRAAPDPPAADAGPNEYTVEVRLTAQQARELLERLRELLE